MTATQTLHKTYYCNNTMLQHVFEINKRKLLHLQPQARHRQDKRLESRYLDKPDGQITPDVYNRLSIE